MFPVKPGKPTFKSYLPQPTEVKNPVQGMKNLEAKLLPGEIVVTEVNFVRKCVGPNSSPDDLWGKLVCTNFKISFVTHGSLPRQKFQYTNRLLGEHDIPLAGVEQVVTVNEAKGKQKVLGSNQKLKFSPTELMVYCKDFRMVRFRFDEAGPDSTKKVCLAIAHYSQPADAQLLFGFEYTGKCFHSSSGDRANGLDPGSSLQTALFDCSSDWDREIKRTGASDWRVCSVNEGYAVSPSLPEFFVVPASLADQDLKQFSVSFAGKRIPMWCWNHSNGSALVRMASIRDPLQQRNLDRRICSAITKSHPKCSDVLKSDLDRSLPNIQEIQAAFVRLRQICVIEPFEENEERWLSSLESSKWLEYVRAFLKHSVEVVYMLEGQLCSVMLQEEEDRDLACVVSSLVQLMLDPHYRSLGGFQSLVQKEWVMAGHRFLDRCNHLKKNDGEECPLFLLFLDCVWQLMNQYPAAFEFTETYLTVLSDSMWIPVFSTFLFNCPRHCAERSRDFAQSESIKLGENKALRFPCVWYWGHQFSVKDQALFNSPLYVGKSVTCVHNGTVKTFRRTKKSHSATLRGPPSLPNGLTVELDTLTRRNSLALRLKPDPWQPREVPESPAERFSCEWLSRPVDLQGLLLPQLLPSHLQLWRLYFLRWVPEAQISRGGSVMAFHRLSLLADEIETLQNQLRQHRGGTPASTPASTPGTPDQESSRMYFKAGTPDDLPSTPDYLTSSFPFSPVGNLCRRNILGTPFSKFLSGAKIWVSNENLANETL
uniref:Myotubularin related protein 10 n=1 Tax=Paramormyrops kingsleyae TaxID=1676925 RepID=A0A3B3QIU2_9TELE|nr:myotubularin-related protein 10-like isoform X1 [Paramormyrops kingsleyae]